MIHLVTFSLNPVRPAGPIYQELMSSGGGWMHELNETWFIDSAETTDQVIGRLAKHFTGRDRLIIVPVTQVPVGMLSPAGWAWFNLRRTDVTPQVDPPWVTNSDAWGSTAPR